MTPDRAAEIIAAYDAAGNVRAAAEALDMGKSTFHTQLVKARALVSSPEPFAPARVSTQLDRNGDVKSMSVVAKPAPGEVHEVPEGHKVKRLSALVDAEGRVIQKWVISGPEGNDLQAHLDALRVELEDMPRVPAVHTPPIGHDGDLLTLYPVVDQHHGLYAWQPEAGEDFDLAASDAALREHLARVVNLSPPSETAIILGLGDFFHADSHVAATPLSGNPLDRDGRQSKVTRSGVRLLRWAVEFALLKHARVVVSIRAGNHDPNAALWLAECLSIAFENNPRVIVDLDPSLFFYARFGRVLIAATHGHMVKPAEFPAQMASTIGEAWGAADFRYGFQGHIHHETKIEKGGAVVETMQTLAGKDAWHANKGYTAGRSMSAITYDRELGEIMRVRSPIRPDRKYAIERVIQL